MGGQEKNEGTSIFSERIEKVRETFGISGTQFAEKLGIVYRTYMNYKAGTTPPPEVLGRISDRFNVSAKWLLTGEGPMFTERQAQEPDVVEQLAEPIPVVGEIQAGPNGAFPYDWTEFYIPRPPWITGEKVFGVVVRGDSMTPTYRDGDVVICEVPNGEHNRARMGEHAVVVLDDYEAVLKIFNDLGDKVRLDSLNKDYEPITLDKSRIRSVLRVLDHIWRVHVAACRMEPDDPRVKGKKE
jgi:SOS-response transcriptional repressor LexA